jgi:hypothetical protein
MLCFRIDVRLLKPFDQAARLLVVLHCNMQHVEKSQLHGALADSALDRRLRSVPRRSWSSTRSGLSTTRVLDGPYHTTQYTAMGVPFEALLPYGICLAVRHCLHSPPPQNPPLTRSTRSSSASPAPVSQRSETFRTVASAPDTPSISGTDKVRNFSSCDNPMPCGNADSEL